MAQTGAPTQLGFLTVLHEASGYLGGYLVTNIWGRPLEFRLSTAVQPNRVQQILYGHTLPGFLHGELIGKTLVEKTSSTAALIFTDSRPALALRTSLDAPVLWMATDEPNPAAAGLVIRPAQDNAQPWSATPAFPMTSRAFAKSWNNSTRTSICWSRSAASAKQSPKPVGWG